MTLLFFVCLTRSPSLLPPVSIWFPPPSRPISSYPLLFASSLVSCSPTLSRFLSHLISLSLPLSSLSCLLSFFPCCVLGQNGMFYTSYVSTYPCLASALHLPLPAVGLSPSLHVSVLTSLRSLGTPPKKIQIPLLPIFRKQHSRLCATGRCSAVPQQSD